MTTTQNLPSELGLSSQNRPEWTVPTVGRGGTPTTHGACGKRWRQRGNSTGHCGGCHRQFDGLQSFDAHQSIQEGRNVCHDPATNPKFTNRTDDLAKYWTFDSSAIPAPTDNQEIQS